MPCWNEKEASEKAFSTKLKCSQIWASKTAVRNFLYVTFTLGKSPFSTRRKEWNRHLYLFCVSSKGLESKLWKVLDIEGWGSLMWEFHCLKYVTLQRSNTRTLVINIPGGSATKVPVLIGIAWKKSPGKERKDCGGDIIMIPDTLRSWCTVGKFHKHLMEWWLQNSLPGISTYTLSPLYSLILSAQDTVKMHLERS